MFGYIRTNKMELKHREILTYKGYYCGICMTLKKEYGNNKAATADNKGFDRHLIDTGQTFKEIRARAKRV